MQTSAEQRFRESSPNGVRTRVSTLRGRSGPPPESAAIRRSPGQGVVVPAGVRSNRWVPRGFSSNASSRPDTVGDASMRVSTGSRARASTPTSPADAAHVQPRCIGPTEFTNAPSSCHLAGPAAPRRRPPSGARTFAHAPEAVTRPTPSTAHAGEVGGGHRRYIGTRVRRQGRSADPRPEPSTWSRIPALDQSPPDGSRRTGGWLAPGSRVEQRA